MLLALGLTLLAVSAAPSPPLLGAAAAFAGLLATAALAYYYFVRGGPSLRLDRCGLTVRSGFGQRHFAWSALESIEVANFGGLKTIALTLGPGHPRGLERRLTGIDAQIGGHFRLPVGAIHNLLLDWRRACTS